MGCQRGGAKNLPEANIKLKTYLDCIPCFFRQALAAARMSSADETIHRRVLNSVALMIPDLAIDATPPEIAQQVYRISYEITGNYDPYLEAKRCANKSAMSLYARMKDMVDDSNETLEKSFNIDFVTRDDDTWEISLIPRIGKIRKVFTKIILRGKQLVEDVEIDEASGNKTMINFKSMTTSNPSLSSDEKLYFQN